MLLKTQINQWLSDPVTQEMLRLIREHCESNRTDLSNRVLYGTTIDPIQMQDLAQLKGQVLAFEKMLNIKEALLDLSEDYPLEEKSDEV